MIIKIIILLVGLIIGFLLGALISVNDLEDSEQKSIEPEIMHNSDMGQSPLMRMRSGKMPIPVTKLKEKE